MAHRLGSVAPSLGDIICKSPCPAPTPPGCIAIAKVPGVLQDASEALRDDKNVSHRVIHFPWNTEVALNEVLRPLEVHEKLMPPGQSRVSAIALTRSGQVFAAKIKKSFLFKSEGMVILSLHVEEAGQRLDS